MQYFEDFHSFLRQCLHTEMYQKMVAFPDNYTDEKSKCMLDLIHHVCQAFFTRTSGTIAEMMGFIHMIKSQGEKLKKNTSKGLSFWNQIIEDDDSIRFLLRHYPNGPLFKVLDVIREEEERSVSFDPVLLGNLPYKLYEMELEEKNCNLLRMPSPTSQTVISKAELIPEFIGFLRSYGSEEKKKVHLLFNLQDSTSWKEYARCHVIDAIQKRAEFSVDLKVITLTKNTEFYQQIKEYFDLDNAKDFIKVFEEQLFSRDAGYMLPREHEKEIHGFIDTILKFIHVNMFDKKKELKRKERLDFIEISYLFIILKCIELFHPDTISFTCKDAVDLGEMQAASLYAFLRMINMRKWSKEEKEYFLWLIYAPAFLIRDRSIDLQCFFRVISALNTMDEAMSDHGKNIHKFFSKLFHKNFIEMLLE